MGLIILFQIIKWFISCLVIVLLSVYYKKLGSLIPFFPSSHHCCLLNQWNFRWLLNEQNSAYHAKYSQMWKWKYTLLWHLQSLNDNTRSQVIRAASSLDICFNASHGTFLKNRKGWSTLKGAAHQVNECRQYSPYNGILSDLLSNIKASCKWGILMPFISSTVCYSVTITCPKLCYRLSGYTKPQ